MNEPIDSFQSEVARWLLETFGEQIASDRSERGRRVVEEGLKLGQSVGVTEQQAFELVRYVYSRPVGDSPQEVGGVLVTTAALCASVGIDMEDAGRIEIERCWEKQEQIRAKQVSKSIHGIGMPFAKADPKREEPTK